MDTINILELPTAGTMGENDFLHVIQGGLDKKATFKQLPVATESSNGLLSNVQFKNMMTMNESDIPLNANDLSKTLYFINTLFNRPNWSDFSNYPHGYGVFVVYGNGYFVVQISYSSSGDAKRRIRVSTDINSWTPWVDC